ncbi:excinuclease ABC subunit UvrC [Porphyromonas circumdentaria]|uniref:UvrABC system protein C n=1 Tax=Porphyromonas circumdentaria TaxID=29524 RepID=A0A1T4PB47_9PORP|nr:excinuclease ABC subunit UvrC [Porphyromonas circumdentaria]MBB6276348.1 excinuclease ABC subunit C [Porphyromonas circumdentaria]SJZ88466.1 Excinuclease ABC subunit C [Porphyromonas circumdentaria]
MTLEEIKKIIPTIPELPGCYQYFDENDTIIYVGKAKNLRRRVASYFTKEHTDRKTRLLVASIREIKYIVVEDESEALLLENSLIKTHKPKYNILLKDDKSYPSIVVTKEEFPRILVTRNRVQNYGTFFGPYTNVGNAHKMVQLIRELYKTRTCRLKLTQENIQKGAFQTCLQYHIKRCEAPCVGKISWAEYNKKIQEATELLKGNLKQLIQATSDKMYAYAEKELYEAAAAEKDQLDMLQNYTNKHTVAPQIQHDVDVFSYDEEDSKAYINMMQVHEGAIVRAMTLEWKKPIDESREDLLTTAIIELRQRFQSEAEEIILPYPIEWQPNKRCKLTIPKQGEKKHLLDLSYNNVRQYKLDQLKRAEKLNPEQRALQLMQHMKEDLRLKKYPRLIECFDNSNIQGTHPVAACVVFYNGKPRKSSYRKFHVKSVIGPNDYASMQEIITRRYSRVLSQEEPLPDLIVIDGGKGQLGVAVETLRELGILEQVEVIGLAERLEEVFYPDNPIPLFLKRGSDTLRTLQHIRDEAHRFGITFHRTLRSKGQTVSELDNIKGIGSKLRETLLKEYKSVARLKKASREELMQSIGAQRGKLLFEALHPSEENRTTTDEKKSNRS